MLSRGARPQSTNEIYIIIVHVDLPPIFLLKHSVGLSYGKVSRFCIRDVDSIKPFFHRDWRLGVFMKENPYFVDSCGRPSFSKPFTMAKR